MIKDKITFIGAGNMGEALIKGILKRGLFSPEDITATDIRRERLEYIKQEAGINISQDNRSAIKKVGIIVLCSKPQVITRVVKEISNFIKEDAVVISITAGITTGYLEQGLGTRAKIVRVMPNTPALINQGVSAISLGRYATDEEEDLARQIFGAVGEVVVVKEELMDSVTAISGSGPAYIFMLIEALIEAGIGAGLSKEVAGILSSQMVLGAARMVIETGEDPVILRQKVTSPGGTTEAALRTLSQREWKSSLLEAVNEATRRSKELGQSISLQN